MPNAAERHISCAHLFQIPVYPKSPVLPIRAVLFDFIKPPVEIQQFFDGEQGRVAVAIPRLAEPDVWDLRDHHSLRLAEVGQRCKFVLKNSDDCSAGYG